MPARKPKALIVRHDTAAESQKRTDRESAMRPGRGLPMDAPARLDGMDVGQATWRRLMREFAGIEGEIVTRLDMDLLVDYCALSDQLAQIDLMRNTTYKMWLDLGLTLDEASKQVLKARTAAKAAEKAAAESGVEMPDKGMGSLAEVERWEAKAVELASKCLDAFEAVVKLDGRADRKRDLLFKLRQSLYLTPRARAGAAPDKKEEEPKVVDPLEALLDDVNDFVNGDGKK